MAKVVYTVQDLMEMLSVKYSTACRIMRQVKAFQNTLNVRGLILKEDWEAYVQAKGGKDV